MAEQYSWISANNEGYSAGKFSDVDGKIMPWSRSTVADGKWLNREMLLPFSGRDQYLLDSLNQTYDECSAFSGYLNEEIRIINARADVIDVVGSHDAFIARSAELVSGVDISDRDVIKILNDVGTDIPVWIYNTESNVYEESTVSPSNQQTYYRWLSAVNDGPSGWEYVGDLEPYYKDVELTENSITFKNTAPERNYTVNTDADKYIQMLVEGRTGTIGLTDEFISSASQVYNALSSISGINEGSISGPRVNHTVSNYSLAQGSANSASYDSFAQGKRNYAYSQSIAAGADNYAKSQSQALGNSNSADSNGFAAGSNNSATLAASFAQGSTNYAYNSSFAQGTSNSALTQSFAQGKNNSANYDAFAQGLSAFANNESLAQGLEVTAENKSFAQGSKNNARNNSVAIGNSNSADNQSFAVGTNNIGSSEGFSHGSSNESNADSLAQGVGNSATNRSLAQGYYNYASYYSLAQGQGNKAETYSLAQGISNSAKSYAAAFGTENNASETSITQGNENTASYQSIAIGNKNSAYLGSVAMGSTNAASTYSQAMGNTNVASAYSQAFGKGIIITNTAMSIGSYNKTSADIAFVIGNGTDDSNRSDLFWINKDGDVYTEGNVSAKNFYINGNPIDSIVSAKFSAYNGSNTLLTAYPISSFGLYANTAKYITVSTSNNNRLDFSVADTLINSASSGYQAKQWINTNGDGIIGSANSGAAASAWIVSNGTTFMPKSQTFAAKGNPNNFNTTFSYTGFTLSAGEGVGFYNAGTNSLGISAQAGIPDGTLTYTMMYSQGSTQPHLQDFNISSLNINNYRMTGQNTDYINLNVTASNGVTASFALWPEDTSLTSLPVPATLIPIVDPLNIKQKKYMKVADLNIGNYVSAGDNQKLTIMSAENLTLANMQPGVIYLV